MMSTYSSGTPYTFLIPPISPRQQPNAEVDVPDSCCIADGRARMNTEQGLDKSDLSTFIYWC